MQLASAYRIFIIPIILTATIIPFNTGLGSVNNGYSEKIEIISLEAKDARDFIDPHIICDACAAAQQFFLSATIKNNSSEVQPFVTIMEIRDQDGITQYLQFQLGELDSNETSNVAISWIPTRVGEFEFRSFVISDLIQPEVLSNIHSTIVKVS